MTKSTEEDMSMAELPSYPGTPRWVKVFVIITIAPVLLVVIMRFTGAGDLGSRRSPAGGDLSGHTPPASVTERGAQQP